MSPDPKKGTATVTAQCVFCPAEFQASATAVPGACPDCHEQRCRDFWATTPGPCPIRPKFTITVQCNGASFSRRRPRADRWSYVIHEPGEPTYVSPYRYHSETAAMEAGTRDAEEGRRVSSDAADAGR